MDSEIQSNGGAHGDGAVRSMKCSATPLDDLTPTKECDCEFTPDPTEPDVESVHYLRRCQKCKATWWSLHCPHDGCQGRCSCGERGQVWPNDQAPAHGSASGPTDTQRLDYLDRRRVEHHAHWNEDGWQNPGVAWEVRHWVKNGTYDFPEELSKASVRDAIDAEMSKTPNDLMRENCQAGRLFSASNY